jgi:hypothetical protein
VAAALWTLEEALQRNTDAFSGPAHPQEEEELFEEAEAGPTGLTEPTAIGQPAPIVTPQEGREVFPSTGSLPPSSPTSSTRPASTLSAIEHQETRSTPRRDPVYE